MKRKKKRRKIKYSKAIVLAVLSFAALFTVTMVVVFCIKGLVPDTLITAVFAFLGGEAGILGLIKHSDTKYSNDEEGKG